MPTRLAWTWAALVGLVSCLSAGADEVDWRTVKPKTDQELAKLFDQPIEGLTAPGSKQCYVYKSELTPAILIQSKLASVTLFDQMATFGLDGPTQAAYVAGGAVKIVGRGQVQGTPEESWLLVWFTGGSGWDKIKHSAYAQNNVKDDKTYGLNVPMLVSLQHKPAAIELGPAGLKLTFAQEAGLVAVMPLMGVNRPQLSVTAGWAQGLPADVLKQARDWNARLKNIPVQVRESYSIDDAKGVVSLIHDFDFVAVKDDWNTAGATDAPVAPAIALAAKYGFPVTFSAATVDTGCPTYFGPLWVVPNAKSIRIEVPGVLDLITKVQVPNVARDQDADLLDGIDQRLAGLAQETGMGWWAAASAAMAQGRKAALIPYAKPATAAAIKAAAMRLVHANVFGGEQTVERLVDKDRGRVYLVDYLNHYQRFAGDDEAPAAEIPRGIFNYAFYTGDWATPAGKWDMLQQAAVASYVKNNWIVQSRLNSGGDTYHDVLVGTAHMARMAAAMGKADDFGRFSYLLARHLLAYYGFEYAELPFARQYQPWFITLVDGPMVVWDIYGPFGGMFTPFDKEGFYGAYSGFYEHYFRMDDNVMPRYYKTFLKAHVDEMFGKIVLEKVPNPPPTDGGKWGQLLQIRAQFLDWDYAKLKAWIDQANWQAKNDPDVLAVLYDKKHPRVLADILSPARRDKPVQGPGIQLQADGLRHFSLDVDTETQDAPGLYWFGFNAVNANVKAAHSGNTIVLGTISPGEGKIIDRQWTYPNWVTAVYGFNLSQASDASKAAAADQAKAKWMILGPFGDPEDQAGDWNKAFAPETEQAPDFAKTYEGLKRVKDDEAGKAGTVIQAKWQPRTMGDVEDGKPLGDNTLTCRWGFNQFGYTYCFTRVYAPQAMKVKAGISSHGGQKVWINAQLAYENPSDARRIKPDDRLFDASLHQGWNTVLVKLKNVEFWEKLYFRLMGPDEQAIPGLRFDPNGQ